MNYILEGNTNFHKALHEALCKSNDKNKQNDNLCLISNQPLGENSITLGCTHSFNYIPLFNEVFKQKTIPNRLEVQRLKKHQIKCPYCRTVQSNILPYCHLKNQRIEGVNWPPRYALQPHRCKAVFASGKKKGETCNKPCTGPFCKRHVNKKTVLTSLCSAILKSGKNKGKRCHYKIKKDEKCGIHQS